LISSEAEVLIASRIDWITIEQGKFSNQQDHVKINTCKAEIETIIKNEIDLFLDDVTSSIKVFELPDVSNSAGILDYTKYFFKVLFEVAKERQIAGNPIKTCVVLEEAHTIIPEWNFSGSSEKTSQGLVNSIGQIALQGRKYGVGFLVIAQRTANVSKTVLTQCNTVVCFQAYDETSFTFLGNYVGKDMVKTLPNLKKYHAIVAGKAFKANIPMIVDLQREL
jgi:DNA helicase HerA-like ATPase